MAEIRGPIKAGKHRAAVDFKDKKGHRYLYDWVFYTDPGDGSVLQLLGPCDRVVPDQVWIVSPAENQAFLTSETIRVGIHFKVREIMYPDSVKWFVDEEDWTDWIRWESAPGAPLPPHILSYEIHPGDLTEGKHTMRIEFLDQAGRKIRYSWNFYILADMKSLAY
jgi:hypothetical protein